MWSEISFKNPWLLLVGIIPVALLFWHWRKASQGDMSLPTIENAADNRWANWLVKIPDVLKCLGLILLTVALARPQITLEEQSVKGEGIDIMLVMDLSGSMEAEDFIPNRMEVSKKVAQEFIDARANDRIGLTIFGQSAFTASPLTIDHKIVKKYISQLRTGMLDDGTAIGMGLATALNRLRESEASSKIVILMTDGENNAGYIEPNAAADIASEIGVKVYTIGVGSEQSRRGFFSGGSGLDEKLLQDIAAKTDGKYFRATNESSLQKIYQEIDQLEKTEIEVNVFKKYSEKYRFLLWWGLGIFLFGYFIKYIIRPLLSV